MLRIRCTAALVGFVPALALSGAVAGPVAARPAAKVSVASFRVGVIRHYGQPSNASGYSVLVATGRHSSWVFGGTNPGGPSVPVAARWNGSTLTPSALPAGLTGFISDASAPSADDVWAASEYGGYVLHWNGQRWAVARTWQRGLITGLVAISANNVWVFGPAAGSATSGAWHYDGTSWTAVTGAASSVYRASAVSRRDIWAISLTGSGGAVWRFDGSRWRRVRTGSVLRGVEVTDILAISSHDVWVAGNTVSQAGAVRLVLAHWNGAVWTRLSSKIQAWAGRLAAGSPGTVLVTATPVGPAATGLVLQASTFGWAPGISIQSALGSGVSDIVLARDGRSLWASGGILTDLGGDAAIWVIPLVRRPAGLAA